jgi:hypothetical protein
VHNETTLVPLYGDTRGFVLERGCLQLDDTCHFHWVVLLQHPCSEEIKSCAFDNLKCLCSRVIFPHRLLPLGTPLGSVHPNGVYNVEKRLPSRPNFILRSTTSGGLRAIAPGSKGGICQANEEQYSNKRSHYTDLHLRGKKPARGLTERGTPSSTSSP